MGNVRMNAKGKEGQERRTSGRWKETMARHVGSDEGARPRKVAPWPWRTTAWNWSEKREQYEATRLKRSDI